MLKSSKPIGFEESLIQKATLFVVINNIRSSYSSFFFTGSEPACTSLVTHQTKALVKSIFNYSHWSSDLTTQETQPKLRT